jgi:hypothetical protein
MNTNVGIVPTDKKQPIDLSQKAVLAIGPWDKQRLQPPLKGNIRLTFLVSD